MKSEWQVRFTKTAAISAASVLLVLAIWRLVVALGSGKVDARFASLLGVFGFHLALLAFIFFNRRFHSRQNRLSGHVKEMSVAASPIRRAKVRAIFSELGIDQQKCPVLPVLVWQIGGVQVYDASDSEYLGPRIDSTNLEHIRFSPYSKYVELSGLFCFHVGRVKVRQTMYKFTQFGDSIQHVKAMESQTLSHIRNNN